MKFVVEVTQYIVKKFKLDLEIDATTSFEAVTEASRIIGKDPEKYRAGPDEVHHETHVCLVRES